MTPVELATMTMITTLNLSATHEYEQYAWFFLFLVLCGKIAVSDSDAQILTVGCVIAGLWSPYTVFVLIFVRVVSELFVVFFKEKPGPQQMSFEDMYPDSLENGQANINTMLKNCF